MLDLAKAAFLIFIYLFLFLSLGGLVLHVLKEKFSFSLAVLSGFFFYHLIFNLVALPCILTGQTLTTLIRIWLPLLGVLLICGTWLSKDSVLASCKGLASELKAQLKKPSSLLLPALAAASVLFILYLSVCSYYMGWDTAFYMRTVLHAVQNDSMYTLDAASGQAASVLSLRYALSSFYMNSAIFCRLMNLHPLILQNITGGSVCVLLAFMVIYRIGLFLFGDNRDKACLAIVFAAAIHVSHASLFSPSEFLLLRSYEAKACCANIVLPFIVYSQLRLWKDPESWSGWGLLFLGAAAANAISMSSLLTVPLLMAGGSLIWLVSRNLKALGRTLICLIPCLLYIGAYLLEYTGLLVIPI